jgi:hypothetical protein
MAESLYVARCKNCSQHDIVLPYSIPLRTNPYQDTSGASFQSLNVACPQCGHVSRHNRNTIRLEVYGQVLRGQLPFQTVWLGVWLRCDSENCGFPVLVESAVKAGTTNHDVADFVSRWDIATDVTCFSMRLPKRPLVIVWQVLGSYPVKP